jgi:hypothetical protein
MSANTMSDKQIALIRNLFTEVGQLLSEEKKQSLITKMRDHISGKEVRDTKWASQVIEALKGLKTKENLRIAKERRAASDNGPVSKSAVIDLFKMLDK